MIDKNKDEFEPTPEPLVLWSLTPEQVEAIQVNSLEAVKNGFCARYKRHARSESKDYERRQQKELQEPDIGTKKQVRTDMVGYYGREATRLAVAEAAELPIVFSKRALYDVHNHTIFVSTIDLNSAGILKSSTLLVGDVADSGAIRTGSEVDAFSVDDIRFALECIERQKAVGIPESWIPCHILNHEPIMAYNDQASLLDNQFSKVMAMLEAQE